MDQSFDFDGVSSDLVDLVNAGLTLGVETKLSENYKLFAQASHIRTIAKDDMKITFSGLGLGGSVKIKDVETIKNELVVGLATNL